VLAELVEHGPATLAFVKSRKGAELVAAHTRRLVEPAGLAGTVMAYRAGHLPEERRAVEQGLIDGSLRGVAATDALELGVDVGNLDAVSSPAGRAPRRPCGSRPGAPAAASARRWSCSSPTTTRSTTTCSRTPASCGAARSRQRSSTSRTPTCCPAPALRRLGAADLRGRELFGADLGPLLDAPRRRLAGCGSGATAGTGPGGAPPRPPSASAARAASRSRSSRPRPAR
jgi:hypothetical protein